MFKGQLIKLCNDRKDNIDELFIIELCLKELNTAIEIKELKIKTQLETDITGADQATIKTKYANAEKRRLELEIRLSSDLELKLLKEKKMKSEIDLLRLESKEKVSKIEEKYLFKIIDLYLEESTVDMITTNKTDSIDIPQEEVETKTDSLKEDSK